MSARTLSVVIAALAVSACGGGGLNQSRLAEPRSSGSEPLNAPIAVGATLEPEIQVDTQGSAAPTLHLESARPEVIAIEGGLLRAKTPGVAAILYSTDDGSVIDFLHIWVAAPNRMTFSRLAPTGGDLGEITEPVELLVGDQLTVSPKLYTGSQRLSGHYDVRWHIDPPLVRVLRDGTSERRRLVAERPGTAILIAESANISAKLELSVIDRNPHPEGVKP
jgi:hypothetical protein